MEKIFWATEKNFAEIISVDKQFSADQDYENPEIFYQESIKNSRVLVVEIDGKIVGFLVFQILWGNTPFLALIKVLPSFQKRGLAKKMVKILEEKMKKMGFKKYISSTENSNLVGNIFHKSLGFKPIGKLDLIFGQENFFIKNL